MIQLEVDRHLVSRLSVLPAILLLMSGSPLGGQDPHDRVDVVASVPTERYRAALRFGAAGDLRAARVELRALLNADPSHTSAKQRSIVLDDVDAGRIPAATAVHIFRSARHAYEGRLAEAVAEGDSSVRLSPSYDEAYRLRGRSYVDLGDHARAIRDYGEAIRLNPARVLARANRANVYLRRGEPAKAIDDLEEAIRRAPTDAEIYVNRGTAYGMTGMFARALADFDRAIQLDSGLAPAYANKALLYENAGQRAESVETLKALVRNARPGYASLIETAKAKIKELGGS
jgi:tetratricopeptide (TPR) repeat protein